MSNEILGTLNGIFCTASSHTHFITTGWIGGGFPVQKRPHPFSRVRPLKLRNSINSGCIKKIPLNPPLQKGEGSECPDLLRSYKITRYIT